MKKIEEIKSYLLRQMGEIKFRGWDNEEKKMIKHNEIDFNYAIEHHNNPNRKGEFILLRFTGFKDNNEKEIYEGDIVDYEVKAGTGELATGLVKWNQIVCGFIVVDFNKKMKAHCDHIRKVIGNLYENPELVKK